MSHSVATPAQTPSPGSSPAICVLLVDDQPIIGETVRRLLLDESDIEFHFCSDPAQAIPLAREVRPTVILQDLVMPDVDGLLLLKFYRANPATAETPVIVLSSKEEPETKAAAFASGASDYLVKLPDRVELLARIRHHSRGYINLLQRNEAYAALDASRHQLAEQMQVAAEYLQSLLPPPSQQPLQIDWRYIPCANLGGDVFGYDWIDSDHMSLFVLDVTGHGVDSALFAVSVMNSVRSRTLPNVDFRDPGQVLAALNERFPMDSYGGKAFTMWYGVYQPSNRTLTYGGGGHPPGFLFPPAAAGEVVPPQPLDSDGPLLGIMEWDLFETQQRVIEPGSRVFVYSDGAHEIQLTNRKVWTFEAFTEYFAHSAAEGPGTMDRLIDHVRLLHGSPMLDDDLTIVEVVF
ncbi:SpoIIE family protein phosphatase [Planctomicrobium piriforme]|uniref:Sigma-B regulation protein RsbU (Phosphoserine phosphatase) n=1 Tax=Planctomicrobium piriforme TaxID=1576369 RepID=A0A1I3HSF4_9PLAN|nr:SpoIIE family protein phosphatase [Planctomicrobium piriforme]SFI38497.1 sigma-B regulation protein RsbU (phosphoserine phosphatase) [Planctomicrobium piriforme]